MRKWRGVTWPAVINGVCQKHLERVGSFTGVCARCHYEQLEASRQGSSEWERKT